MVRARDYKPISAYGAIGNMRTAALIGRDGSIDWCCLPRFDSPSVFAALLDAQRGGRFRVSAEAAGMGEQQYVDGTNVLKTRFSGPEGVLAVTDLMPLAGDLRQPGTSSTRPEIHRILECEDGEVLVDVEWSPRFDYGRILPRIRTAGRGWFASGGNQGLSLSPLEEGRLRDEGRGYILRARFRMESGDRRALVVRWNTEETEYTLREADETLQQTAAAWRAWAFTTSDAAGWAGSYHPLLLRSKLVLKLLDHAESGAIVAAPTTSLPEAIGGRKNWDYRYAWIRDASLTAQALIPLGHGEEAVSFLAWMEEVERLHADAALFPQPLYAVDGQEAPEQVELPHLEGYRGSRPVRIGGVSRGQLQLDVFFYLLDAALALSRMGRPHGPDTMGFLQRMANRIGDLWREPDHGIWECRGRPRHFVHSKVMAWAGLDRAIALFELTGAEGDADRWRRERENVRRDVLANGYDEELGSFVLYYGSKGLDAANLRIPILGFLPAKDCRVQGTIGRTLERLTRNGFVHRYCTDAGLPKGNGSMHEGAFVLCTFWLADALLLSGRLREARGILENVARSANHVGLFGEMVDPADRSILGNFPQGFSHLGLITCLLYLACAEGREIQGFAPAHRLRREQPGVAATRRVPEGNPSDQPPSARKSRRNGRA